MLSGTPNERTFVEKTHIKIIHTLVRGKVDGKDVSNKYHAFVRDCFDLFVYKKEVVVLRIGYLERFEGLQELVVAPETIVRHRDAYSDDYAMTVLRPRVFAMFGNLKRVVVDTRGAYGYHSYIVSLSRFLEFIQSVAALVRKDVCYEIRACPDKGASTTWIDDAFTDSVRDAFRRKRWSMQTTRIKEWTVLKMNKMF